MPSHKITPSQIASEIEVAQAATPLPVDRVVLGSMSTMHVLPTRVIGLA